MNFFQKKETPIQNMTFMALMSAINVVVTLLTCFLWYLAIVLILILPLTSVLVGLYCKKRYYPLYIICSLLLCYLVTIYDPINTLFYVFPALLSGFCFSIFVKIKFPKIFLIIVPAIINLLFNYLAIPFINYFYGQDILNTLQQLLFLTTFECFNLIVPSILFIFSFIQALLSFLIIKDELIKFKYDIKNNDKYIYLDIVFGTLFLILKTILCFYYLDFAYLMMIVSMIFFLDYIVYQIIKKPKINSIVYLSALAINIFLFLSLYQYMDKEKSLLILDGFTFISVFDYLINYQLLIRIKKDKINS